MEKFFDNSHAIKSKDKDKDKKEYMNLVMSLEELETEQKPIESRFEAETVLRKIGI